MLKSYGYSEKLSELWNCIISISAISHFVSTTANIFSLLMTTLVNFLDRIKKWKLKNVINSLWHENPTSIKGRHRRKDQSYVSVRILSNVVLNFHQIFTKKKQIVNLIHFQVFHVLHSISFISPTTPHCRRNPFLTQKSTFACSRYLNFHNSRRSYSWALCSSSSLLLHLLRAFKL